jgi:hypothetical protein
MASRNKNAVAIPTELDNLMIGPAGAELLYQLDHRAARKVSKGRNRDFETADSGHISDGRPCDGNPKTERLSP